MDAPIGLVEVAHAAELAAFAATGLALVTIVPQVRRLLRHGDTAGVSLSAAALGVVNEAFWIGYFAYRALWWAAPESIISAVASVLLIVVLTGRGVALRRGVIAAAAWAAVLGAVAIVGGHRALGAVLVASFIVQLAPAVWVVYRTVPTGVASATWGLFGAESLLWTVYGAAHRDPPTASIGLVGVLASAAILARTTTLRQPISAVGIAGAAAPAPRGSFVASAAEPALGPPRHLPEPWVETWAESWVGTLDSVSRRRRTPPRRRRGRRRVRR